MTTALVPLDTLAATIRAHVAKGDASIEKAEQHYKSAGCHLLEAKERVKQTPGLTWPRFLIEHCQIRRARADELIMIADGRTTLADLRIKKAESVRKTRERKKYPPLRSGGSGDDRKTEPVAVIAGDGETARLKAEIDELKRKLAKADDLSRKTRDEASVLEGRAQTIECELEAANLARLYAEQDKERLAAELEAMRADRDSARAEVDRLKREKAAAQRTETAAWLRSQASTSPPASGYFYVDPLKGKLVKVGAAPPPTVTVVKPVIAAHDPVPIHIQKAWAKYSDQAA